MAKCKDDYEEIFLKANKELRLLVNESSGVFSLEILDGNAEIFGVEMIIKNIYTFSSSMVVVTRHGCTLKLVGEPFRMYTVSQTNEIQKIHEYLEGYRTRSERDNAKGPVTLITGPTDVGKSTLTRSLINYAARLGRNPLYFDLDVGQSSISIPGTMSVLPIDEPEDLNMGFSERNLSVYYFGYKSPGPNMALYFLLINKLGESLHYRMSKSKNIYHSGAIIDTCGWVIGQGYQAILTAARSFQINVLIVLSDENLHSRLKEDLPSDIDVQFIPKLEGAVTRSKVVRISRRDDLIRTYFYGTAQCRFKPYTIQLKFSEVQVVIVMPPTSQISIHNLDEALNSLSVVSVPISHRLHNHILAISHANNIEDAMLESVLGFIYIMNVDMEREIFVALSPQPDLSQKRILVMGDIQYKPYQS